MTASREFLNPKTLMQPSGYSHIAKASGGTTIYLAGQVSSDASGKLIGEGNLEAQAEQVFKNLKNGVEAAGGTLADVVKMNVYILAEVDPGEIPKFRAVRDRYVNTAIRRHRLWLWCRGWRGRAGSSRSRRLPWSTAENENGAR